MSRRAPHLFLVRVIKKVQLDDDYLAFIKMCLHRVFTNEESLRQASSKFLLIRGKQAQRNDE